MLPYCLKCNEETDSKSPKVVKIKTWRIVVSSNCEVWGHKNLRFIKDWR